MCHLLFSRSICGFSITLFVDNENSGLEKFPFKLIFEKISFEL